MFSIPRFIAAALFTALLFLSKPVDAQETVIALSPFTEKTASQIRAVELLEFILSRGPGERVTVIDGYNIKTIGTFTIPTDPRYKGKKARLAANRTATAKLMTFAKNPASGASNADAVKFPQLLRYVSNNLKTQNSLDVLVIGSVFYDDPAEPAFSIQRDRYPGDGHLSYSRGVSPFGARDDRGSLESVRVHFAYTDDATDFPDRMDYNLYRFWTLYIEALGGSLVSFVGQTNTALNNIHTDKKPPAHGFARNDSDKLEMIEVRPVTLEKPIFERPVTQAALSQAAITRAEKVELGISWGCAKCDLDLYAKAFPGASTLFFGRSRSAQGVYWKDYTNSPEATNGFETISFNAPLDLRALTIAVNFYRGVSPGGVSGELRISVDGQTYASPFTIKSEHGIRGGGVEGIIKNRRSDRRGTIVIDALKVIGSSS